MTKKYATSVYSQKSTTSAKSYRSYFSFTTGATIWPLFTTTTKGEESPPETLDAAKHGIWKNLKSWMPSKKLDNDDIMGKSSTGFISSPSRGKWKKLLASPTQYIGRNRDSLDKKSPASLLHDTDTTLTSSSIGTTSDKAPSSSSSSSSHQHQPTGILVNGSGTAEEIAEKQHRRRQRRLYLMRLQQSSSHRFIDTGMNNTDDNYSSYGSGRRRQVGFSDISDSPTSSRLLATPNDSPTSNDNLDNGDLSRCSARVMFVEPSPVPRFRNEPPAPPPSPPFLNVIVRQPSTTDANKQQQPDSPKDQQQISMMTSVNSTDDFTTMIPRHIDNHTITPHWPEHHRPRLIFNAPLHRGQTIVFSLQNTIPGDHVIVYKFLTSNSKLFPRKKRPNSSKSSPPSKDFINLSSRSSSWTAPSSSAGITGTASSSTERYFVRPSAGRMTAGESHSDIRLFLNQVPPLEPGDILKDKILVRWAVIQRGTQVEEWAQQLKDSTRRKWLEMLLDTWPDQVVERKTRISIRFV